jgi:hypothetical protein
LRDSGKRVKDKLCPSKAEIHYFERPQRQSSATASADERQRARAAIGGPGACRYADFF